MIIFLAGDASLTTTTTAAAAIPMYSMQQFSQPSQMNPEYSFAMSSGVQQSPSETQQRLAQAFMPTTTPTSMWMGQGDGQMPMYSFDTNSNMQQQTQQQQFQQPPSTTSASSFLPTLSTYSTYPQVQNQQMITTPINLQGYPPISVSTNIPEFQFKTQQQ